MSHTSLSIKDRIPPRIRTWLGPVWRSGRDWVSWGLSEFPKSPGLELYSKIINRDNVGLHRRLSKGREETYREYIAPYLGRDIPRIVWTFWAQGEEQAPCLVRRCIASWRDKNPTWDVRVLTSATITRYVDLPPLPEDLALRLHANLLRLKLLVQHGGVWADATTLCHRPLDEWMPLLGGRTGFFVFRGPHFDRWIDNWFLAAHHANPLIQTWARHYVEYVTQLRKTPKKYFMMIYALQWQICRNKALRHAFRSSGGLPAVPAFFLQGYLEGRSDAEPFKQARAAGFPVSKLNWRLDMPDELLAAKLDELGL